MPGVSGTLRVCSCDVAASMASLKVSSSGLSAGRRSMRRENTKPPASLAAASASSASLASAASFFAWRHRYDGAFMVSIVREKCLRAHDGT